MYSPSPHECSKLMAASPLLVIISEKLLSNHRLPPSPYKKVEVAPISVSVSQSPSNTKQNNAESISCNADELPVDSKWSLRKGKIFTKVNI